MGSVSRLNHVYGTFFKSAGYLSVSPYYLTYHLLGRLATGGHEPGNKAWEAKIEKNGLLLCISFTIIPVLPALMAITLSWP